MLPLNRQWVWTRSHSHGRTAIVLTTGREWLVQDWDGERPGPVFRADVQQDIGAWADRAVHDGGCDGRCGEWQVHALKLPRKR